jgi:hypothetical protein
MKKIAHSLLEIVSVIILVACGGSGSSVNSNTEGFTAPTKAPAQPRQTNTPANAKNPSTIIDENSGEVNIPKRRGNPPAGILEQVSWFGGGGGLSQRDCDGCYAIVDDDSNLKLVYFEPFQQLDLILYRRISDVQTCGYGLGEFVTVVRVQVDENGTLLLPLSGSSSGVYVNTVIDADTGHVIIPGINKIVASCGESVVSSCPGAPEQRLKVGGSAYVCTQKDRLIMRDLPGNGSEIMRLETGTRFSVIGGPNCTDDMSWWRIEYNGTTGWVSEGGDRVDPYFICPAP